MLVEQLDEPLLQQLAYSLWLSNLESGQSNYNKGERKQHKQLMLSTMNKLQQDLAVLTSNFDDSEKEEFNVIR